MLIFELIRSWVILVFCIFCMLGTSKYTQYKYRIVEGRSRLTRCNSMIQACAVGPRYLDTWSILVQ